AGSVEIVLVDDGGISGLADDNDMPGDPETAGTTPDNFTHSATLKNPNPPIHAVAGERSGWKNEYYIFLWNDDAPAMKVERYINDEVAAANIMPFSEARKLWTELAAHGFERSA
ncbi:unnamed protein product, partial [marine sediment metagenome]